MRKHALLAAATAVATATGVGLTAAAPANGTPQAEPLPSPSVAVERARSAIGDHLGVLRATGDDTFRTRDVIVDRDGSTHVRMDRFVGGLKVLGGDVVVHQDKSGAWQGASLTQRLPAAVARIPRIRAPKNAQVVIEARKGAPRLAYLSTVSGVQKDGTPSVLATTVDALTGATLVSEQRIHTATGDGQSLYHGTVPIDSTPSGSGFTLTDPARGNGFTSDTRNQTDSIFCTILGIGCPTTSRFTDADNHWGNGTTSDRATAAVDAHYGAAATYDYYKQVHGRNGIFGDGRGVESRVHYGTNYVNAFWDGRKMTYGDGDNVVAGPLVSLDVAAHEMSHGVMSATANLTYSGESGGLNEANSDIFAALVELRNSNAQDPGDWLVGEEIMKDRPALRYMDKPSKDGNSVDCWRSGVGNLDVHYSSGVGNHFAYLAAEGSGAKSINGVPHNSPTCNGSTITGIGADKLGKIWYRAITTYMTSSTNYAQARTATLNAARDLFGAGSLEQNTVAAAWSAVSVN